MPRSLPASIKGHHISTPKQLYEMLASGLMDQELTVSHLEIMFSLTEALVKDFHELLYPGKSINSDNRNELIAFLEGKKKYDKVTIPLLLTGEEIAQHRQSPDIEMRQIESEPFQRNPPSSRCSFGVGWPPLKAAARTQPTAWTGCCTPSCPPSSPSTDSRSLVLRRQRVPRRTKTLLPQRTQGISLPNPQA